MLWLPLLASIPIAYLVHIVVDVWTLLLFVFDCLGVALGLVGRRELGTPPEVGVGCHLLDQNRRDGSRAQTANATTIVPLLGK